nr:hypothetical protein [Candidatus Sigynarchaeota archaeon]
KNSRKRLNYKITYYHISIKGIAVKPVLSIALVAIFSALITVSYLIPLSIILGGIGFFKLTWVLQTITGILLGPILGSAAALIGSIIGTVFSPSPFGPIALLLPVTAAMQAGLLAWGYRRVPACILGGLTIAWLLVPAGLAAWPVAFFYVAGILLMLFCGKKTSDTMHKHASAHRTILAWMIVAYSANITRHVFGNILSATIFGLGADVFIIAIPFTATEQLFFALGSALIGVPLIMAIERSNLMIPFLERSKASRT